MAVTHHHLAASQAADTLRAFTAVEAGVIIGFAVIYFAKPGRLRDTWWPIVQALTNIWNFISSLIPRRRRKAQQPRVDPAVIARLEHELLPRFGSGTAASWARAIERGVRIDRLPCECLDCEPPFAEGWEHQDGCSLGPPPEGAATVVVPSFDQYTDDDGSTDGDRYMEERSVATMAPNVASRVLSGTWSDPRAPESLADSMALMADCLSRAGASNAQIRTAVKQLSHRIHDQDLTITAMDGTIVRHEPHPKPWPGC